MSSYLIYTVLRPKVFDQPAEVFVIGRRRTNAGMGGRVISICIDEFECALIHPFTASGVTVGKSECARL